MPLRQAIEARTSARTFSGRQLAQDLLPLMEDLPEVSSSLGEIRASLGALEALYSIKGLIRASFLIELVKPDNTSTKFDHRWSERLATDPRGATYDECLQIYSELLATLASEADARGELLSRFNRRHVVPYELPIDYEDRSKGHELGNVVWIWNDPEIEPTLTLRELIASEEIVGPLASVFKVALGHKVKVKTYLTDRAQTGTYQTNREKRWEYHPEGVQYASRLDCLRIEHKLLSQLCFFDGFPPEIRQRLLDRTAINNLELPARCPITRDAMDFEKFRGEIEDPTMGRSSFQVGHLNPLKGPGAGELFGHTARNVAWISNDGNRIQGPLSYVETCELIDRCSSNRLKFGNAPELMS